MMAAKIVAIVVPSVSGSRPVLWSNCSTVELLLFHGSIYCVSTWLLPVLLGGPGVRVTNGCCRKLWVPGGSYTAGTTWLPFPLPCRWDRFVVMSAVSVQDLHTMVMQWMQQTVWDPTRAVFLYWTLGSWEVCSCKPRCLGISLLFYNSIVSPLYCQYLSESGDTAACRMCYLINMFFFHVLKDAEPWKTLS